MQFENPKTAPRLENYDFGRPPTDFSPPRGPAYQYPPPTTVSPQINGQEEALREKYSSWRDSRILSTGGLGNESFISLFCKIHHLLVLALVRSMG